MMNGVSILVLVDVGLRRGCGCGYYPGEVVSILVLVDVGLRPADLWIAKATME